MPDALLNTTLQPREYKITALTTELLQHHSSLKRHVLNTSKLFFLLFYDSYFTSKQTASQHAERQSMKQTVTKI